MRLCRCWQSKKFPYCDDTHKVLMEAGDNVGPFVAKLRGGFEDERRGRRGALQQSLSASQQQNAAVSPMIHASLFSKQETAFSSSNSPSSLADGVERIAFSPSRGGSAAAAVVHSTAAAAVLRSTAAAAVFPPAAVGVPSGRAGAAAAAACRFSAGDTLRRPSVALCRRGGMLSAAVTGISCTCSSVLIELQTFILEALTSTTRDCLLMRTCEEGLSCVVVISRRSTRCSLLFFAVPPLFVQQEVAKDRPFRSSVPLVFPPQFLAEVLLLLLMYCSCCC